MIELLFFVPVLMALGVSVGVELARTLSDATPSGPGPPGEDGLLIDGSSTDFFLKIDDDNYLLID